MYKTGILVLIILFASCTKDVSIDNANRESKIVVNSFFSPQGSLLVNISKSSSVLAADTFNYVNNADIELFQGGSLIGKLTYSHEGYYSLPASILPAGEYSITVSVPGMNTVTSKDTVPVQVPILSFDTVSVNSKYLLCQVRFQDIPNKANYYLVDVTSKYPVLNSDSVSLKYVEIIITDNIVENGSIGDKCKRIFFADDKIQGKAYELSFLLEKGPLLKSVPYGSNTLYINLKSIGTPYYKYLKTYYEAQTRQMDVYSNIVNGYGIFAGYNISQDSIVIQQ